MNSLTRTLEMIEGGTGTIAGSFTTCAAQASPAYCKRTNALAKSLVGLLGGLIESSVFVALRPLTRPPLASPIFFEMD